MAQHLYALARTTSDPVTKEQLTILADSNQELPICPACGRDMKFARLTVAQGREVGLNTFECGPCHVSFTTAAKEPNTNKH